MATCKLPDAENTKVAARNYFGTRLPPTSENKTLASDSFCHGSKRNSITVAPGYQAIGSAVRIVKIYSWRLGSRRRGELDGAFCARSMTARVAGSPNGLNFLTLLSVTIRIEGGKFEVGQPVEPEKAVHF